MYRQKIFVKNLQICWPKLLAQVSGPNRTASPPIRLLGWASRSRGPWVERKGVQGPTAPTLASEQPQLLRSAMLRDYKTKPSPFWSNKKSDRVRNTVTKQLDWGWPGEGRVHWHPMGHILLSNHLINITEKQSSNRIFFSPKKCAQIFSFTAL